VRSPPHPTTNQIEVDRWGGRGCREAQVCLEEGSEVEGVGSGGVGSGGVGSRGVGTQSKELIRGPPELVQHFRL
jgi:hypothetical protein